MNRYRLINYTDVWNSSDGWEINNQCIEFDDLYMDENITNKEILQYLKKIGFLVTDDLRRIVLENYGDILELFEKKSGCPICRLEVLKDE